ncbi:MAG: 3-isopropylmalate dehydratase small subunit [Pseudomonadota bacterium]
MKPFTTASGAAMPLPIDDVNTDQMAPASAHEGADFGKLLFYRWREDPDFVLNQDRFKGATILVTGSNFGCGSSRETAVWALAGFGFKCIIARSFSEVFRENCLKNGLLPVVLPPDAAQALEDAVVAVDGAEPCQVDLETQQITCPGLGTLAFTIPANDRAALLKGTDEIALSLEQAEAIGRWEQRNAAERPWLQHMKKKLA